MTSNPIATFSSRISVDSAAVETGADLVVSVDIGGDGTVDVFGTSDVCGGTSVEAVSV